MTGQQSIRTSGDDRVIQFRPRALAKPAGESPTAARDQDNELPESARYRPKRLSRFETAADNEDADYRHRMFMNLAALVFTLLLTGLGVWLATTIADMRRTQDCILVGRRDCARIPLPRMSSPLPGERI